MRPFYKNGFFIVGSILTIYIFLRAWFVAPLHDENATFYHFIETGAIMGKHTLLDANNHLFNSYLGRWMYLLFGEHFFLFRLPTVIAFGFYYAALVRLTASISGKWQRWLVLLATVCIPFITDYFAYTRGYGLALCFFVWSLVYLQKWIHTFRPLYFLMLLVCGWFSAFSNLTLLMSSLLLVVFAVFSAIVNRRQIKLKTLLFGFPAILFFALAIRPLINFTMELRNANALYYGSLDGFWNVTGKTLCRYVLFTDGDWLKWALILCSLAGSVLFFLLMRRNGFKKQLQKAETIYVYFIAGNVIIILFLAKMMQVNYPEDRAGMYLIPLTILAAGHLLYRFRNMRFLIVALLFFPLSFLTHLNPDSSVFTPDQRMKTAFYLEVRKRLRSTESLCIDPIQQLNWAHFERTFHRNDPHPATLQRPGTGDYDVIITNSVFPLPTNYRKHYRTIAFDKENGLIALQRKQQHAMSFIRRAPHYQGSDEYIELFSDSILPDQRKWRYACLVRGKLQIDTCYRDLQIVMTTENQQGDIITTHSYNLRWYLGERTWKFPLIFSYARPAFLPEEVRLKARIWNPEHRKIFLK